VSGGDGRQERPQVSPSEAAMDVRQALLWEMPSRRLFRRVFACTVRGRYGSWRLRQNVAEEHLIHLSSWLAEPFRIPASCIIKRTDDKIIFRWQPERERLDWVVKAYYSRTWRRWRRDRRRAYGESLSQLCAECRGLRTPAACGYGQYRLGAQRCVFICGQHIPQQSLCECFRQRPDPDGIAALLDRAGAMLHKLYRAGCNHVDFGPHAMLISAASPEGDVLIDFESASFLRRPSSKAFAAQAGYFAWSVATNRDWVERRVVEQWFAGLLQSFDRRDDATLWDIWRKCFRARQSLKWRTSVR
jgi:hypothetical protein